MKQISTALQTLAHDRKAFNAEKNFKVSLAIVLSHIMPRA